MSPTQSAPIAAQEKPSDPAALQEGPDPANAAVRKTAWNVPPPPPATAASGGIIGGEELWPALPVSTRALPKSASSDSLSLSDGSAAAPEDLIVPVLPASTNPISPGLNPTSILAPSNAIPDTSLPENGKANPPNLVVHDGGNGSSEVAATGGNVNNGVHISSKNSSSDDDISCRSDVNLNNGVLGAGRGCNNSRNNGGGANDNARRIGTNGNSRGGFTSSGEGSSRNGGGGNHWSNNFRHGNGSGNGNGSNNTFGSRGGRNRRDHERGGSFSARNYPRFSPVPQHLGMYQPAPGSFHGSLPPPPPGNFMVQPAFMPYMAPFAYPADAAAYPYYMVPIDQQLQNMHLAQQPMHSLWVQQGHQQAIRQQIEYYFSIDNLCHNMHLRRHMNVEGWVTIDLLVEFPRIKRFIDMGVDRNFVLDAIRGSEVVEVQGNNVRRRNDWARWVPH